MKSQAKELEEFKARTQELDKVAKMLVRRDLELSETRAKREQELEKIALIFSNLSDGLILINGQGRLELFNPAAEQMFGVRARDILGRTFQDLETFPRLIEVARIVEEKKEFSRYELPIPPNKVLEVSAILLRAGEVKDQGVILVSHDITREKQVEQLKTEFVSLAAHQLRTPLSAMKWAMEALLDGDAGPLAPAQRELLLNNRISNERMIALVNDLLDVTRIEEGRYLYQPAFSQFEELAQDVVLSYRVQADLRNIALVFDLPKGKFPRVLIDKEKMLLVIHNLVDNALRYSHPGGRVEVTLSHDNKEVVFSIKDSGIGIPDEQKSRLFEKFFRASNAKQIYTEGTGLGLYLSKNIIEAHEGKIWAESRVGQGSTFSFSLPIKQEL